MRLGCVCVCVCKTCTEGQVGLTGLVKRASLLAAAETDYLTASTTRETMADITITEIGLENTLLLDAINKGKARFVSDCASYLQVRQAAAWCRWGRGQGREWVCQHLPQLSALSKSGSCSTL